MVKLYKNNKYTLWHDKIISKAQYENRTKLKYDTPDYIYYESHHILPKCLGGDNSKDNLVLLTAKEHYIVHALLYRMTTGNAKAKMAWSWSAMKSGRHVHKRYFNSRLYDSTRVNLSGKNNPMYGISLPNNGMQGKNHTKEVCDRLSEVNSGKGNPFYGKKHKRIICEYCKKDYPVNTIKRHIQTKHKS